MKEKFDKLEFLKIRNLYSAKDIKRIRRQATDQKKMFVKDKSDKEMLLKIVKELKKLKNKKTTQFKNEPKCLTDSSPKINR